ncbi:aminopeptidase P family protein [Mucilaginibacter conchicola]|uniref:Xaa-Pro aminopeptidase n=1 Tax=Mucilaginibacter conchicola TaxID=2303333 RepID=A0A372NR85_9SPHI|nr:aminopeptidase P family protein [Mucilaginibacter conchicola]RFZ91776.1 aminopeptidase P family protein [Mucilaginibacter conchicola]
MKALNKALIALSVATLVGQKVSAQDNIPKDYLTKEFHAGRREALRKLMPANSVAVVFAYPERVFSNDVNYVYHANPDLYYFSGYKEPDAALLVFKELQGTGDTSFNEILYVRKRDPQQEQWTGRRLGTEGAKTQLGFKRTYNSSEFAKLPVDLKKFTVFYDNLPDAAGGALQPMIEAFKVKAGVKTIDKGLKNDLNVVMKYANPHNLAQIVNYIKPRMQDEAHKSEPLLQQLSATTDSATLEGIKAKLKAQYGASSTFDDYTNTLRGIKQPEEIALMSKTAQLSAIAHAEVMKAIKPSMSERELEGILMYVHKKYGAEDEGYPPIVGVGANACILHYEENNETVLNNQLVLLDVGSEYHGYSADVTRTVPPTGKFTDAQKAIYQVVYDAQEQVIQMCKAGVKYGDLEKKTGEVLAAGLIKLGIIADAKELRTYYPHGVSHHVGLDVHDKGSYAGNLEEGMVITVEPGIYIPAGSKCDKKWWNIGVRIEDDILVGKDKFTNLSADAPRTWQDVEKMAAQNSIFDGAKFPPLK